MKKYFFIISFFTFFCSFSQENENTVYKVVDSLFREDQFYVSVSYNLVQNRPSGFKQFGFSQGFSGGFLRDFPITKDRNWAIAPGIGYSYNNIKQFINSDILIPDSGTSENIKTTIITHGIDIPLEIRWRNATPLSHKFWRIYAGIKATYVLNAKLKFESSFGDNKENIINDVNRWQYGAYLSFGFNTWNPYIYYGLNPVFKEGSNRLTNFNLGFIFYIL